MLHRRSLTSCALVLGLIVLGGGCNKSATTPPAVSPNPQPGPSDSGPFAAGRKVFAGNGCANCHSVGGTPMAGQKGGKQKGPDLGKVGADPAHTPEWFAAFVRDPKATKPDSRMPAFQGKISDDDFKALVEYLASLK